MECSIIRLCRSGQRRPILAIQGSLEQHAGPVQLLGECGYSVRLVLDLLEEHAHPLVPLLQLPAKSPARFLTLVLQEGDGLLLTCHGGPEGQNLCLALNQICFQVLALILGT